MVWFVVDYGFVTLQKASASAFVVAENVGGASQMQRNVRSEAKFWSAGCAFSVNYDSIRFREREPLLYAFYMHFVRLKFGGPLIAPVHCVARPRYVSRRQN